ncbi:hypothetical protein [Streptomyces sp. NPDC051677]|uniref:hypothetical protein n=1 Tax=Streptomyces sp. NPDC051677 TaxID=3365669 RepID=UPI0037D3C2E6
MTSDKEIITRRRERITKLKAEIGGIVQHNRRTHAVHLFGEWVALTLRYHSDRESSIRSADISALFAELDMDTHSRRIDITPSTDERRLAALDVEYLRSIDGVPLPGCPAGRPTLISVLYAESVEDETAPLDSLSNRELAALKRRLNDYESALREERERLRAESKRIDAEHRACHGVALQASFTVKMNGAEEVPFYALAQVGKRVLNKTVPFSANREAA